MFLAKLIKAFLIILFIYNHVKNTILVFCGIIIQYIRILSNKSNLKSFFIENSELIYFWNWHWIFIRNNFISYLSFKNFLQYFHLSNFLIFSHFLNPLLVLSQTSLFSHIFPLKFWEKIFDNRKTINLSLWESIKKFEKK